MRKNNFYITYNKTIFIFSFLFEKTEINSFSTLIKPKKNPTCLFDLISIFKSE